MNYLKTRGIILKRTNYLDADRIYTILTADYGKIRAIAKSVRKQKSKLAGGLELLGISDISFIKGKGQIYTLTSTRQREHYGEIVSDINRNMAAYDCIKIIDKNTDDNCEEDYFQLLAHCLEYFNNLDIPFEVTKAWFLVYLLKLLGHSPNFSTSKDGTKLEPGKKYQFDFDSMSFFVSNNGEFKEEHIKFLRLILEKSPKTLSKIDKAQKLSQQTLQLLTNVLRYL